MWEYPSSWKHIILKGSIKHKPELRMYHFLIWKLCREKDPWKKQGESFLEENIFLETLKTLLL